METGEVAPPPPPVVLGAGLLVGVAAGGLLPADAMLGLLGSAGLGLSTEGLLPGRLGGVGPLPPPPPPTLPPPPWREGGWAESLGMEGEGSLRGAPGGVGEGRDPLIDPEPRWGRGGPSRVCEGEEGRLGGRGGESLALGEVLLGEVTLLGRGGAMSRLELRVMGGGGRSCWRCWREGEETCLPLAAVMVEEEGVWRGTGGRGMPGTWLWAVPIIPPTEMLSTREGVSSPRRAASTATHTHTHTHTMTLYIHNRISY